MEGSEPSSVVQQTDYDFREGGWGRGNYPSICQQLKIEEECAVHD